MSDEKFQNKYRIKSARAMWHDYSGGAYFISVCTKNREHSFGEIVRCAPSLQNAASVQMPTMKLSPIGQFLTDKIQNITNHCPYTEIPLFVVMPNHWHAIVFIDGDKTPYIRCANVSVQTGHAPSVSNAATDDVETGHAPSLQIQMQKTDSRKGWLSVAIGGLKSAVTKFANSNHIDFAWQTRFHDHIIRDQNEMNRIADYIQNNPQLWENDCYNRDAACRVWTNKCLRRDGACPVSTKYGGGQRRDVPCLNKQWRRAASEQTMGTGWIAARNRLNGWRNVERVQRRRSVDIQHRSNLRGSGYTVECSRGVYCESGGKDGESGLLVSSFRFQVTWLCPTLNLKLETWN